MHFSDEQAMLQDSAAAFCRAQSPMSAVRQRIGSAGDDSSGFDRPVWQAMAELGWLGISIPEALGGSGLTLGHTAVIAEAMGRQLMATPYASTLLCIEGLLAGASPAQQALWLPKLALGGIATVALFEDEGDWDLLSLQCRAERNGASLTLQGAKTLVLDAAVADLLLVSLQHNGAPALLLLPAAALPRQHLQREAVIDETRRSYRLTLDGLSLPAEALITGTAARQALQAIRQAALLLASAEAAGGIAGVLAVTVDYLNNRSAFGRKIGSYQALKHGCADMLIGLERARSHLHHAATLLIEAGGAGTDTGTGTGTEVAAPDSQATQATQATLIALRMAKVEAGDSFVAAGDRSVQFHGGFGFTYDCDAQLYLHRALWLQPWFGDAAHHRRRLADLLLPLAPQRG
jgi:alkylation response protein AidB-like acyl-CoA dehydrogenase